MTRSLNLALAFVIAAVSTLPVQAQSARVLGEFRDWASYAADDGTGTICFALSKPKSTEPSAQASADAYVYVTNRPSEDVRTEFNVVAGYTFQTGSIASVAVGSQRFPLFTQGDAAWLDDSAQAANLAAAIRAGSTLVVTGTAADGTQVTQSYSLSGATAAQQAIGAEC